MRRGGGVSSGLVVVASVCAVSLKLHSDFFEVVGVWVVGNTRRIGVVMPFGLESSGLLGDGG